MINYIKRFRLFILSLVLVLAFPLAAPAGSDAYGEEQQTMKVGYINYEGFIQSEGDGYFNGYGVAFLSKISQYTGWDYEYKYYTWEDCLDALEKGEIDLVCCAQKNPQRAKKFDFAGYPIGRESTFVYTRKGSDDIYYQDYGAMDGTKAAVLKGSYQSDAFASFARKKGFSYQELNCSTVDEITDAVKSGAADLAVLGSLSRQTDLRIVEKLDTAPFYIITTKGNSAVLNALNDALRNIYSTSPYIVEELYL